jgi:ParB/RepB/Spo0J family partition protein
MHVEMREALKVAFHDAFPVAQIDDSNEEFQARLDYDEEEISRLVEDIEHNGLRNPIGLKKKGETYQIIYGFQRLKAVKKLGLETVKANIYEDLTEEQAREQAVSDNVRHGDLTDYEKSVECLKLKEKGYSVDHLCVLFGVKKSIVYNHLSVANLDATTKFCLHKEYITLNHTVELARIEDVSKRLEALTGVLSCKWSVRDLKRWITERESPIFYAPLNGWIDLCPKSMKMESLDDCKKCEYHKGIDIGEDKPGDWEYEDKELVKARKKQLKCSFSVDKALLPLLAPSFKNLYINEEYARLGLTGYTGNPQAVKESDGGERDFESEKSHLR